jgi:repressor LexA
MATEAQKIPLTRRQNEILQCIRRRIQLDGFPPTIQELCAETGLRSTNAISQQLSALEKKGYIRRRSRGESRGIQLLGAQPRSTEKNTSQNDAVRMLIIAGAGNAESSLEMFLNPRGRIGIDTAFFGLQAQQRCFAAKIDDAGMATEGILKDDTVIVEQGLSLQELQGGLVLALVHDLTIVRRLHENTLIASAKGFPRINFSENDGYVAILGKVTGCLRSLHTL